ncbi:hypothetical protein [Pseudomonas sp. dw_612]|uniref:hypothetical protein n=1 Tax=Pseudomonas sp. dw_612 TaxID=2720080 RepID=UPI001BD27002|nr:hypothetical protein [Pseudomonas sp. dw_612]
MNAKQEVAEIDRELHRSQSSGVTAGPPPRIPDIISATDRRVYVSKLGAGARLQAILPIWPIQDENDRVSIHIKRTGTAASNWKEVFFFFAGPVASRPPEYTSSYIPADELVEDNPPATPTSWDVEYRARPAVGNFWRSDTTTVIIDRRAPYQAAPGGPKARPPQATLPTLSAGNLIDDAFIGRNPGGMVVTVPMTYQNPLPADHLRFYISRTYSLTNPERPLWEGPIGTGTFTVPVVNVRAISADAVYAYYIINDEPGNVSALSAAQGLGVRFAPLPVLEPPIIPLARDATDQLIDIKDCREPGGVTIELKRVDEILSTDEVRFMWNAENLGDFPFLAHDPLITPVPFDKIFADYYKDGPDTETDVPVKVECILFRGNNEISRSSRDIFSNIYYPGPVNPVDPAPVNNELNAPHITSTAVDDILEPVDYNKEATVTITLWTDVDKPVKAGQQIFAEYAGQRFGPVFLTDGQTTVDIPLPWVLINNAGFGPGIALQYFVSDIGGVNENPSPIQPVTNNAIVIELEPPSIEREFPDDNVILCSDLTAPNFGAVVKIPGDTTHLLLGRKVTLRAQGYRDEAMSVTSPGTAYTSTPHEIIGTEPADGFEMVLQPYDPFIRNIPVPPPAEIPEPPGDYHGYWKVWYEVDINGTLYPSDEFISSIYLVNARGEYCEEA